MYHYLIVWDCKGGLVKVKCSVQFTVGRQDGIQTGHAEPHWEVGIGTIKERKVVIFPRADGTHSGVLAGNSGQGKLKNYLLFV